MITREDVDKFKAEWELEIDKYQAKDPDCMDVDEQAYYEAVQLAENLLTERDGLRRELRFEQEGSSLYVKKISELLNKIERLEQKR